MSTESKEATNLARLGAAGVNTADLQWFLALATESDLDRLPADALFLPGQRTNYRDTLIDLKSGRPVYLQEAVPAGSVFCLLGPLKPLMRR
ncbi:MAG TPA: hypothetical protein VNL16_20020 [Chloroflexota bacterium]|nr:hypothetical protein [Chloroflexota bacterium]